MSFYLGNSQVDKVFLGEDEVDFLILGLNRIFRRPNAPIINLFSVIPNSVRSDHTTTAPPLLNINWRTTNATSISISEIIEGSSTPTNIPIDFSGANTVGYGGVQHDRPTFPMDAEYTLTATNTEGSIVDHANFRYL